MQRIIDINSRLILMRAIEDRELNPRRKRAIHSSYVRERRILIEEKDQIIKQELLLPKNIERKQPEKKASIWNRIKSTLQLKL